MFFNPEVTGEKSAQPRTPLYGHECCAGLRAPENMHQIFVLLDPEVAKDAWRPTIMLYLKWLLRPASERLSCLWFSLSYLLYRAAVAAIAQLRTGFVN